MFQRQADRLFSATRGLLVPKNARKLGRSIALARIWRPALLLEARLQLRTCLKRSRCEVFRLTPGSFCLIPRSFLVVLTGPNFPKAKQYSWTRSHSIDSKHILPGKTSALSAALDNIMRGSINLILTGMSLLPVCAIYSKCGHQSALIANGFCRRN